MSKMMRLNRWTISIACCSVLLCSALALALNVNQDGKHTSPASGNQDKHAIVRQVEASPDQSLRVAGNDDCPLRLVEVKVKEVPAALFTRLTGKVTDLASVSSVPEATLVNHSGQTITRFFLAVRDPHTRSTRGILQSKIALKPGDSYTVSRDHFAAPETMTVRNEDGTTGQKQIVPGMDSEKKWIQFASRSAMFITVAKVDFADGGSWSLEGEGELK
ncbi:MAG TPA: hypothetical protein VEZ40_01115 [Pyrinomonadaceae bacterium]|nr:hypothetical protein [Pyrinomonadaceae bacterium]